jgi:hypothetical protein
MQAGKTEKADVQVWIAEIAPCGRAAQALLRQARSRRALHGASGSSDLPILPPKFSDYHPVMPTFD